MGVYYNENDPFAAAWLRNLIKAGLIAPGDVDERSIADVDAIDLIGYDQCHFFAGIGGWSYALRLAGWPDDRPVWTGSCPCQPFSAAGKRKGTDDERHLWPEFRRLIGECEPAIVFGEQVASKDGRLWLAGVRADLEALAYAVGGADLCAAGVGAPHIRQRLYWVADATSQRECADEARQNSGDGQFLERPESRSDCRDNGAACGLADADGRSESDRDVQRSGQHGQQPQNGGAVSAERMGDTFATGFQEQRRIAGVPCGASIAVAGQAAIGTSAPSGRMGPAPTERRDARRDNGDASERNEIKARVGMPLGFWTEHEWLACLDGKARRIEPASFPLAHGVPARMGRLRGYGNAIVPQVAATFVRAVLDLQA